MARPRRHASDTQAVAPAFAALTVKVESTGETHEWRTAEQDGWDQTANPPWATEAKTGFREGARFGWGAAKGLNGEWKFSDESDSRQKNHGMAGAMKRPSSRITE